MHSQTSLGDDSLTSITATPLWARKSSLISVRCRRLAVPVFFLLAVLVFDVPSGLAADDPDTSAPTCVLAQVIEGPPRAMVLTARDDGSGLSSVILTPMNKKNSSLSIPSFPVGTTAALDLTLTKLDQTKGAQAAIRVSDVAGNSTVCGPVMATVFPRGDTGKPKFVNLPQSAHLITVYNATPGLTKLAESVNFVQFSIDPIAPGEVITVDVSSAMSPGDVNTITLRGQGEAGANSEILVWDGRQ